MSSTPAVRRAAFTLIEILVVATIIGLLAAGAFVSYSQFNKQSRDAKRKADLELVRQALEQYRSDNGYYPNASGAFSTLTTALATSPVYISSLPTDPLSGQNYTYQYAKLPAGCDNSATLCSDYTVYTLLEGSSSCGATATVCKTGPSTNCNYCSGPYGKK